jgi:hypothetical protein
MSERTASSSASIHMPNPFGCLGCLVTILLICAVAVGLATPWGRLEIDFFPPAVRLEKPPAPEEPAP